MTIKNWLRSTYRSTKLSAAASTPTSKKLLVVYGNCQAEGLRQILMGSPALKYEFKLIQTPGVHEISRDQIPTLMRILSRASVVITQDVRENYRDLAIGTDQVLKAVDSSARTIRFPSMHYTGLHPYLVYVHATGQLGTPAPLTEGYHDLRFIHAASRNLTDSEALVWLCEFESNGEFIRSNAASSLGALRSREKNLDITISEAIPQQGAVGFWTVNHPSNAILTHAASSVLDLLGKPSAELAPCREILTSVVVPVSPSISRALGYAPTAPSNEWVIGHKTYEDSEILAAHLRFYRANPRVLSHALAEHDNLLARSFP